MALEVSTSSGKGDLPAEAQCTQLLSHAKVHRQGKMYKGPLLFNESNPNKLLEKCYLTLHKKSSKRRASADLSDFVEISNTVPYESLRKCFGYGAHCFPSRAMRGHN
jgi:hypothetical protein